MKKEIRKVFNSVQGTQLLNKLREEYVDVRSNKLDPLELAYEAGQRDLILDLIHTAKVEQEIAYGLTQEQIPVFTNDIGDE